MIQSLDAGALFASKCCCLKDESHTYYMSGPTSLSLRHMENARHFIKVETCLVVHTFVSIMSSTKHGVQKRIYLSITGQSLVISGRSWRKKKRPKRKAGSQRSRSNRG